MAPKRKATNQPTRQSERQQVTRAIKQSKKELEPVKRRRFRRPKQRKSCHFLRLPGELRNRIYEYALVSPSRIHVKADGPAEPALLRVCKLIRSEARTIYYTDNDFLLEIQDYDGAAFSGYGKFGWQYMIAERTKPDHANVHMAFLGRPNWANLVKWVKACAWGTGQMRPELEDPMLQRERIMGAAFKLSDALRYKVYGEAWDQAFEALHLSMQSGTLWAK